MSSKLNGNTVPRVSHKKSWACALKKGSAAIEYFRSFIKGLLISDCSLFMSIILRISDQIMRLFTTVFRYFGFNKTSFLAESSTFAEKYQVPRAILEKKVDACNTFTGRTPHLD